MLRVLTVFGTRPEAIKMAPVISELEKHPGLIENRNCLTGQHKDMSRRCSSSSASGSTTTST